MIVTLIEKVYSFLWGDLIRIPLPGGSSLGISLLILLLIPTGIYFTVRTRCLPVRLFPDMLKALVEKKGKDDKSSLSSFQTLIVSTATRVGMGNLVGVVAAVSAGVQPIISIITWKKDRERRKRKWCFRFCLPFPV